MAGTSLRGAPPALRGRGRRRASGASRRVRGGARADVVPRRVGGGSDGSASGQGRGPFPRARSSRLGRRLGLLRPRLRAARGRRGVRAGEPCPQDARRAAGAAGGVREATRRRQGVRRQPRGPPRFLPAPLSLVGSAHRPAAGRPPLLAPGPAARGVGQAAVRPRRRKRPSPLRPVNLPFSTITFPRESTCVGAPATSRPSYGL